MKEISNSTLALLVVMAIVVSVFGTLMSVGRLNELGGAAGLTGMLSTSTTQTGTANLTVPSTAFINLTDNVIEFGTLNPTVTNTSDDIDDWFILRNDGSVNISVQAYSPSGDNQTGGSNPDGVAGRGPFTSTTTGSGCLAGSSQTSCFMIKCLNLTTVSSNYTDHANGATCNSTYEALPLAAGASGGASSRYLTTHLLAASGNDTAFYGINVTVPEDEPSGVKEQTIEFLGSES